MATNWIQGVPSAEAVIAHGARHPAPEQFHVIDASFSHISGKGYDIRRVTTVAPSGFWLCVTDDKGVHPNWPRMSQLCADAEGNVYYLIGFSIQANVASDSPWAVGGRWLPVTAEGLPADYWKLDHIRQYATTGSRVFVDGLGIIPLAEFMRL